jgi:hypothetical protein
MNINLLSNSACINFFYNNVKVSFIIYKLISKAPVTLYKQPTYYFLYNNTIKYTIAMSLPLLNKKKQGRNERTVYMVSSLFICLLRHRTIRYEEFTFYLMLNIIFIVYLG